MSSLNTIDLLAAAVYAMCYVGALLTLRSFDSRGSADALISVAFMGVILPLLAVALTRGLNPPVLPDASSAVVPLLTYLIVFSVLVLGIGFSWLHAQVKNDPTRSGVLLVVKLMTMVAVPAAILAARTGELAAWLAPRWYGRSLWIPLVALGLPMLAFQVALGRGLTTIAEKGLAPAKVAGAIPLCFVWLLFDTALPEEFLFRVAVQSAIADRLLSPVAGVLLGALLFGTAHAPGLFLRNGAAVEGIVGSPGSAWAIAYSIAVISPVGIVFGTLWALTRSLAVVVVLHATMDLIPNVAGFVKSIRENVKD